MVVHVLWFLWLAQLQRIGLNEESEISYSISSQSGFGVPQSLSLNWGQRCPGSQESPSGCLTAGILSSSYLASSNLLHPESVGVR